MSLQSIINWWNNYARRKREVVSCGAWPAAVPPWADIFLLCCADHDSEYIDSEMMYAQGVLNSDLDIKARALEIKQIADEDFQSCVRARYNASFFLFRPIARAWGEQYIELVLANGDRIWFHSIGVIIAEFESGEHPTIKTAMRRAQTVSGESKVIQKALSRVFRAKGH